VRTVVIPTNVGIQQAGKKTMRSIVKNYVALSGLCFFAIDTQGGGRSSPFLALGSA
jgi:hypothetical protein